MPNIYNFWNRFTPKTANMRTVNVCVEEQNYNNSSVLSFEVPESFLVYQFTPVLADLVPAGRERPHEPRSVRLDDCLMR